MVRLLGSRKFIDLPAGTLYTEYWLNSKEDCDNMIEKFKSNPEEFSDITELLIYNDNGSSLVLGGMKDKKEFILTDINVVGDACPATTLRVVFDLENLPEVIKIRGANYDDRIAWTKQELLKIIIKIKKHAYIDKNFLNWAHENLDNLFKNGNNIIDVEISATKYKSNNL